MRTSHTAFFHLKAFFALLCVIGVSNKNLLAQAQLGKPFTSHADQEVVNDILSRLKTLEKQNQELANQNQQLQSFLENGQMSSVPTLTKNSSLPLPTPESVVVEEQVIEPPKEAKAGKVEESLKKLQEGLETIQKSLRITTKDENFKVIVGGAIVGDFLFSTGRPVAPGTPFFLTPNSAFGFEQDTFDTHARQTSIFALVSGPDLGSFKTGGFILANFYEVSVIEDQYGFLPLEAFAQLKNDNWRFAAGLQFDIFNPLVPTVLPFSLLIGSGNTGNAYRGQARIVRYLYPSPDSQITIQTGVSEPVSTFLSRDFLLSEDNGWPNVEGRVAFGFGPKGEGLLAPRPVEVGISGVIGQLRNTDIGNGVRVVTNVWGVGGDVRWAFCQNRCGIKLEGYVGQGLGTYGGAILATVNPLTFEGIRSVGGWGEVYYYICPEVLHTHIGYGIDDPVDGDLGLGQPLRNQTYFANLLWDITKAFRLGLEVSYRKTSYSQFLPDNEGVLIQTQVRYQF